MARVQPVVEFPTRFDQSQEQVRQIVDTLRESVGKVCPILNVAMLLSNAGVTVPLAAAGVAVTVEGTYNSLDFLDAHIDSCRLIVRGLTAAAGPITVQLYDVTNAVVLATVTVTTALLTQVGLWTSVAAKAGERVLALRVVGDGANAQTVYAAHSQYYTARFLS